MSINNETPQLNPQSAGGVEWRQLHWQTTVSVEMVAGLLERLATSPELGTIVLETRATPNQVRWLIATNPNHIEAAVSRFTELPVRVSPPRRSRTGATDAGTVRLARPRMSLDADKATAISRAVLAAMSRLRAGESLQLQVMLAGRLRPIDLGTETVSPSWLELLFGYYPVGKEQASGIRRRHLHHGYRAVIRLGVTTDSPARSRMLLLDVFGALRVAEMAGTRLRLVKESPAKLNQVRRPWRYALKLSSEELVGLIGWPVGEPPLPAIGDLHPKALAPTSRLVKTVHSFATTDAPGLSEPVGLAPADAKRGLYLLGPIGSAKSTVMLGLIEADMKAGRPMLIVDPKGDLQTDVLSRVPANRTGDIVVIDPLSASPVGLNPLHANGQNAEVVADSLLATFKSVFATSWGIRSADILSASFLTLTRVPGANLLWLSPLLTNPAFRRKVLKHVHDPLGLGSFWDLYDQKTVSQQAQEIGPVLNKLRSFLLRPSLRATLGQSQPRFNLADLFDPMKRPIVIVSTNKGLLGPETSRLIASLVISQLWPLILARAAVPERSRRFVPIYLDEVHDLLGAIPGDLAEALSMSRSLGVGFTMAHQYLKQLSEEMRAAIDANVRSKVYWGLESIDAEKLAKNIPELDAQDLRRLPRFHAYANLLQNNQSSGWMSITTNPPSAASSDPVALKAASETHYGRPAVETEQAVLSLIQTPQEPEADSPIGRRPRP